MTEKELYQKAFSAVHASPEMIEEVITMESRTYKRHRHVGSTARRGALIAAVVALIMLLGVSAYAVYTLSLRDAQMEDGGYTDVYVERDTGVEFTRVLTEDGKNISMSGVQGTADYEANQEFATFYNDYVTNDYYGDEMSRAEWDEWMEAHEGIYPAYTTRLEEKILELCDKYGLKTRDSMYDYVGLELLEQIVGVEEILDTSSFAAFQEAYPDWYEWLYEFRAYDDGGFKLQGTWWADSLDPADEDLENGIEFLMYRHVKGSFQTGYISVDSLQEETEESYTTARGDVVCLVMGASEESVFGRADGGIGIILYDGADAFVSVMASDSDAEGSLTVEELKALADAIDFAALGAASQVDWPEEEAPSQSGLE